MADALGDDGYTPFRSFGAWAAEITTSGLFNDYVAHWADAKERATEADKAAAVDFVVRSAALETGAIEGLYRVPRGITFAVALQAAEWQLALRELGDDVQGHFEAQLEAFETIFDVATGGKPVTEVWLRELHAITCRHQATYRVLTPHGWQDRPLKLGSYKTEANHVTLAGGATHSYCPVVDVAPEMARLIAELGTEGFLNSPPVAQTAYFHHSLTTIHPFADGNGRVARAASSVFLYRAAGIPLVIFADQSDRYLDALAAADLGDSQPFVQFVEDRSLDTLGVVRQRLEVMRAERVGERLSQLLVGHNGLTYAEVEAIGRRIIHEVQTATSTQLESRLPGSVVQSHQAMSERCSFGRPYHSPPDTNGFKITLTCTEPVTARSECTPMLGIADEVSERYVYTMIDANRPDRLPLQIRLDEVHPTLTEAGRINMESWAGSAIGALLDDLANGIQQGLAARGYQPQRPRHPPVVGR